MGGTSGGDDVGSPAVEEAPRQRPPCFPELRSFWLSLLSRWLLLLLFCWPPPLLFCWLPPLRLEEAPPPLLACPPLLPPWRCIELPPPEGRDEEPPLGLDGCWGLIA